MWISRCKHSNHNEFSRDLVFTPPPSGKIACSNWKASRLEHHHENRTVDEQDCCDEGERIDDPSIEKRRRLS